MARSIIALARSFPSMQWKFEQAEENGLEPFDLLKLIEASKYWSPGEKLIVQFIATAWNSAAAPELVGTFDVGRAFDTWDDGNWAAFRKWVNDPYVF